MKRKVLVTGATGFIGNYIVNELLSKGLNVIATSSTKEKARTASWFSNVTYIPFNFDDFDESLNYYDFFQRPDLLIHLTWEGLPNYKADFHLTKNFPLQKAFLGNMLQHGLKDLTVTGTCFEYGMKEGCLEETMECEPANPYASAKNDLRIEIEKLTQKSDASFKWLRLFYMYGKGQSSKSLISQLDQALENKEAEFKMSGGEQVRDFLPVEKVASYIVEASLQTEINGVINCCSGQPVKVKTFVRQYLQSKGKSIRLHLGYYPYADYEPMSFWGSDKKLKTIKTIK